MAKGSQFCKNRKDNPDTTSTGGRCSGVPCAYWGANWNLNVHKSHFPLPPLTASQDSRQSWWTRAIEPLHLHGRNSIRLWYKNWRMGTFYVLSGVSLLRRPDWKGYTRQTQSIQQKQYQPRHWGASHWECDKNSSGAPSFHAFFEISKKAWHLRTTSLNRWHHDHTTYPFSAGPRQTRHSSSSSSSSSLLIGGLGDRSSSSVSVCPMPKADDGTSSCTSPAKSMMDWCMMPSLLAVTEHLVDASTYWCKDCVSVSHTRRTVSLRRIRHVLLNQ